MTFIELLKYFKYNQIVPRIVGDSVQLVGDSDRITEEILVETKRKESRLLSLLQQEPQQIKSVEKRQYYPATSAQRRIYFLQELDNNSCAYNVSLTIPDIENEITTIKEIIVSLMQQHECLRTSFFLNGESLYQRVWDNVDIEIDTGPGQVVPKVFDLKEPPLMRISYTQQKNGKGCLFFILHHIITDGISLDIIRRDVVNMLFGGRLKPQRVQYKDYACWFQTEARSFLRREQAYWLQQFSRDISFCALPTDFKRPEVQRFEGTTIDFFLSADEIAELTKVCKECEVTVYMAILSIVFVLIENLSGQPDIVIGTFVTGRRHQGLESIVGMFVNTLPIRCKVSFEQSLRSFLQTVKQKVLDAVDHQDYPFEDLVDKLLTNRDTSRNPLFDVAFTMSNSEEFMDPSLLYNEDGCRVTHGCTAKFDCTFSVLETRGKQMIVSINYSDSLFRIETIKSLIKTFRSILSSLSAKLDEPLLVAGVAKVKKEDSLINSYSDMTHVDAIVSVDTNDPVASQLKEIWSQVLKVPKEELDGNTNVFELGGHSLKLLNIYTLIKKKFGTSVPLMYLYQNPTIEAAREALVNKLFFFSPVNHFNNSANNTIFCFPPIIGVSFCYRGIASYLKEYRISCFNYYKVDNLVESYVDKILEIQAQGPYVLLGYSIGGLLLYPVAKELERRGLQVSKIITLDGYWDPYPGIKNPDLIYSLFDRFSLEYNVDVMRQEFYELVFEYDNFLKKLEYDVKINADIHFIISQGYDQIESADIIDKEIVRIKARMSEYTTKCCNVYKGYGNHNTMLDDEAGPQNATIIKKVLSL